MGFGERVENAVSYSYSYAKITSATGSFQLFYSQAGGKECSPLPDPPVGHHRTSRGGRCRQPYFHITLVFLNPQTLCPSSLFHSSVPSIGNSLFTVLEGNPISCLFPFPEMENSPQKHISSVWRGAILYANPRTEATLWLAWLVSLVSSSTKFLT